MKLEFDYKKSSNYIEYSFALPINSLFYEEWDVDVLKSDERIIREIVEMLNISFDKEIIENNYWDEKSTVEVFHGENPENFIYFNLFIDPYDQCNMVVFGVRLERVYEKQILDLMLELYFHSKGPCSDLRVDYFNKSLYHAVFNEESYFYKNEKYKGQKLIHHNLDHRK